MDVRILILLVCHLHKNATMAAITHLVFALMAFFNVWMVQLLQPALYLMNILPMYLHSGSSHSVEELGKSQNIVFSDIVFFCKKNPVFSDIKKHCFQWYITNINFRSTLRERLEPDKMSIFLSYQETWFKAISRRQKWKRLLIYFSKESRNMKTFYEI